MTQKHHITARRLSRPFPIICIVVFLENFDVNVRDRFVESVGESKVAELNPLVIGGSYIEMYPYLLRMLAANNDS